MDPSKSAQAIGVAAGYDTWASTYDSVPNAVRDAGMRHLRRWTIGLRGKQVLELGCGTGLNTVYLAEHALRVTAIDFSSRMLAEAAKRVEADNVSFHNLDLLAGLPFNDASFDVAVITLVLEHIADLGPVYAEVFRLLKPDGRLVISELHPYRQLQGKQARLTGADGQEVLIEAYRHSVGAFVNEALAAGFYIDNLDEECDETGFPRLFGLSLFNPDYSLDGLFGVGGRSLTC